MKSIVKQIIFFIIILLPFAACDDDFLTQSRLDAVGTGTFWNNRENIESNLAACYSVNIWEKWSAIRIYMPDYLRGDDCYPKHFVGWYGRTGNFTNNSSYEGSCENSIWELYYKGIFYCNQVITYTPDAKEVTPEVKDSLIAEARFLRGYYHFELYKHFKKIIYMDVLPQNLGQLYPKQTPEQDILTKLVADFTFAAAYLPRKWDTNNTGRATQGAAYGYLGKSYLWFRQWDEAAKAFAKVDELGYTLLSTSNWGSQFYGTSKNSAESIFEIQFRKKDIADNRYNLLPFVFTPYHWGEIVVSDTLFKSFCSELTNESTPKPDPRLIQSIAWQDTLFVDWKGTMVKGTICTDGIDSAIVLPKDITYYRSTFEEYGRYYAERAGVDFDSSHWVQYRWIKKYTEVGKDFVGNEMSGLNFIRMRYADVLLMHAEALNEAGRTEEAVIPFNKVRKRARMREYPPTVGQSELREAIRTERWKELAFEGHRYFDMVRWYTGEEIRQRLINAKYPFSENYQVGKHELLPIPLVDLQANPSLEQNSGY